VVDAAIYDGSAHMMNLLMALRQAGGFPEARGIGILDGPHWSRTYATSDGGWMSVQCLEPKFYATFLDLLGLSDDPEFSAQYDAKSWARARARLTGIFSERTRDDWSALFLGTDACVAPVLSPDEAQAHEMNTARAIWSEAEGVLQAAPAPRFASQPDWAPSLGPERGAHTDEILAELARKPG